MTTLTHFTDVGLPSGNGVDSTTRIEKQYQRLGVNAKVVNAGNSPFHIAFAACTDLSPAARKRAAQLLETLAMAKVSQMPVALNSAPRNSDKEHENGKEDHIYRLKPVNTEETTFLLYGPEVLKWTLAFVDSEKYIVEKILSITDLIPDTSSGSQFRSGEHLPIVHFLEAKGLLDDHSVREAVIKPDLFVFDQLLVAPPDEYGNGRLITTHQKIAEILEMKELSIPEISANAFVIQNSLTKVTPGELSIWPSSNHFLNENLGVLNIGTRWKAGTTATTDKMVIDLAQKLAASVGQSYSIKAAS